jgi:acyl-CoA dehydrogenase
MTVLLALVVAGGIALALLHLRRGFAAWTLSAAAFLGLLAAAGTRWEVVAAPAAVLGAAALAFGVPSFRRRLVTAHLMPRIAPLLPRMGETERVALEAGTVGFDGQLFSGRPDWSALLAFRPKPLSDAERGFLGGPVERLCEMLDEWEIEQQGDLPEPVWTFLREQGFFGMILPPEYGGLGFSAAAHSAVVTKLASRSITAAVTVMVPNSLGPGELLLHYGTDEQKRRLLPRLARGEETPCFALTGPEAGSDAGATQSVGVVCRGQWEGREVLGMRLTWNKRYITLGPVATLIGLAFRLRDPDRLLGDREDLGITCALVPASLPGIRIGERHDPLGIPFQNGPNTGRDVFVPLDAIIGGPKLAGEGWRMLMETLAVGRSISLPAVSVGGAELSARVVSAYAMVREQFDTPIGRFEGVEEPIARIAGLTYCMNATRVLTAAWVDAGERPAVLSAIAKAYLTEGLRAVVNDAMDVRAGAAIMRGPRNILARAYQSAPIGITVEGANILTRSMIIYGQGAIRCHPHAQAEMRAVAADDLAAFDRSFWGHVGFVASNAVRALLLGLSEGRLARAPLPGAIGRSFTRLTRWSTAFALVSDAAMGTLGGQLKRRERITGRLADALAWMYLASASLKRFADEGCPERDRPLALWACAHAELQIERALRGVLDNLPARPVAWLLRPLVLPLGARRRGPDDALGSEVASRVLDEPEARLALTRDIYVPPHHEPGLGRLEAALVKARGALALEARMRAAVRAGRLDHAPGSRLADLALEAGVIDADERKQLHEADEARDEVIQVDAFRPERFRRLHA